MSQPANASTDALTKIQTTNMAPQTTDHTRCSPKIPFPFPDGGLQTDWPSSGKRMGPEQRNFQLAHAGVIHPRKKLKVDHGPVSSLQITSCRVWPAPSGRGPPTFWEQNELW